MTVPTGRLQFFTLEASDYLERLAVLAAAPTPPAGDDFVRLARALRGTALMAGLNPFSQAASGVEQIAKACRDGQWDWTPANTELLADGIEELKRLVRRASEWSDADSEAAVRLGSRLVAGVGGGPPAAPRPAPASAERQLTPNVRAFIAREGALVAGSLEHAAQAMALGPIDQAAELVLRRLQPLRGLGSIPELTPLPDFLDAIELTLRTFREQAAPPSGATALRRVAAGLSSLARDVAEGKDVGHDVRGLSGAATALLESFGSEEDVVPIDSLFVSGDPDPIVERGTTTERAAPENAALELVGLADRLRQAADQLHGARSETGRQLFLYGVLLDLRPISHSTGRDLPGLVPLLTAIERAVASGAAGRSHLEFAERLRAAASALSTAAESRNAVFLEDELAPVVTELGALAKAAPPKAASVEPDNEFRPSGPDDEVVPIEALAPDDALAPDALFTPFERSFSTLYRLEIETVIEEVEVELETAETELPAPVAAPEPVLAPVLTREPEPAVPTPPAAIGEADVVPIEDLLYRGRRALERADEVRLALSGALRARQEFSELEPLVSELIDLVPLALAE